MTAVGADSSQLIAAPQSLRNRLNFAYRYDRYPKSRALCPRSSGKGLAMRRSQSCSALLVCQVSVLVLCPIAQATPGLGCFLNCPAGGGEQKTPHADVVCCAPPTRDPADAQHQYEIRAVSAESPCSLKGGCGRAPLRPAPLYPQSWQNQAPLELLILPAPGRPAFDSAGNSSAGDSRIGQFCSRSVSAGRAVCIVLGRSLV